MMKIDQGSTDCSSVRRSDQILLSIFDAVIRYCNKAYRLK